MAATQASLPRPPAINKKLWITALVVALLASTSPGFSHARSTFNLKDTDLSLIEIEKSRLDALADQAFATMNPLGSTDVSVDALEANRHLRELIGSLDEVSGSVLIYKRGNLVSGRIDGTKRSASLVRQASLRGKSIVSGRAYFAEMRTVECLTRQSDQNCDSLALRVRHTGHIAIAGTPAMEHLPEGNRYTQRLCILAGDNGASAFDAIEDTISKNHAVSYYYYTANIFSTEAKRGVYSCKEVVRRNFRQSASVNGQHAKNMHDLLHPKAVATSNIDYWHKRYVSGVLFPGAYGEKVTPNSGYFKHEGYAEFIYSILSERQSFDQRLFLSRGDNGIVRGEYVLMVITAPNSVRSNGIKPLVIEKGDFVVNPQNPFQQLVRDVGFLCDETWKACISDNVVSWSTESSDRVRLDIDGCKDDVCVKGAFYGHYTYRPEKTGSERTGVE